MTDRRTRAQERQEAVDGEAPFAVRLRRRLREGTVPADKLKLYAWCGDGQAREVLGISPCVTCHGVGSLGPPVCGRCKGLAIRDDVKWFSVSKWASGLVPLLNLEDWHGPDLWACGRCSRQEARGHTKAIARARQILSCCKTGERPPTREEAHRWRCTKVAAAVAREAIRKEPRHDCRHMCPECKAVDAVDAWLACPCDRHELACRDDLFHHSQALGCLFHALCGYVCGLVGDCAAILAGLADPGVDIRTVTLRTVEGWL